MREAGGRLKVKNVVVKAGKGVLLITFTCNHILNRGFS